MIKRSLLIMVVSLFASLSLALGFSNRALAFDPFGGVDNPTCDQTNIEGNESPVCSTDGSNPLTGTDGVITKIANIIALMTGIAAVIVIMVGGFEYVRSGGDSSKVNKAKNTILFAVIGLVIVVVARTLVALAIDAL